MQCNAQGGNNLSLAIKPNDLYALTSWSGASRCFCETTGNPGGRGTPQSTTSRKFTASSPSTDGMPLKHCPQLGGPDIPQDRGELYDTDFFFCRCKRDLLPAADFAEPARFAGAGAKRQVGRGNSLAFQPERTTAPESRLRHFSDFATTELLPLGNLKGQRKISE